ncbi:MAG TPA: hypothetical protein GX722_00905 [Clostridiales bacterium]|nr:hypothetical protein [Clostridiales bacterium]
MKVCVFQPPYSTDFSQSDAYFDLEMEAFDRCDPSMDLIVFPEYVDVPCMAHSAQELAQSRSKYFDRAFEKACETAKRCNAVVFFNAHDQNEKGLYNTTFAIDRKGNLVGKYFKQHLTPSEVSVYGLVNDYTLEHSAPTVIEIDGVRYCFLTCYDFYFYEAFPAIARQYPDIIIGCSHQRSDRQSALEVINRFCAYNCNAYVVRSSVSMGEDTDLGGGSCVIAPDGEVLLDMKSRTGLETVEIDPNKKYYKPAGFGNPDAAHHEYIDLGRRPWKYRPAGSSIVPPEEWMGYPRTCAHRGFISVAPENSMPAYGAAVAMGAEEIEFDLWWTKDGEIVSIHDDHLERLSDGEGYVYDHTLEELRKLDFGSKFAPEFAGMQILTFEDILKKFACQTIMNIHIKTLNNNDPYEDAYLEKIIALIDRYDCRKWVYLSTGNVLLLKRIQEVAPDIACCVLIGDDPWDLVDRAIELGIKKVQLFKPYFNQEMIDKAHAHGIRCNVCWSNDPEETERFLTMGIDTILTDDYYRIAQVVKTFGKK